jgi:ABC-type uncharacterized transport system involved in gliding motility auxiliary subunit
MSTRSQQKIGIGSLVLLALAFVVAVSVSNVAFRGWRIDLTEDRLYTLSDGTRAMLAKIEEPCPAISWSRPWACCSGSRRWRSARRLAAMAC